MGMLNWIGSAKILDKGVDKVSSMSTDYSDDAIQGIEDFVASGNYDPGGSQSTGTSFQESSSGGSSSSSSSSQSGYNLENAQILLDQWETTYGGIEDNLSEYYNNLDPVKYATQYKSNLNENIDKQLGQVNDELASSGLMSAGMRAQSQKEAAFAKATGGAQADLAAEDTVANMKRGFLNEGDAMFNMANNALTGISSSSSSSSSSSNFSSSVGGSENQSTSTNSNYAPVSDIANIKAGQATQQASDTAGFVKGGINLIGGLIGD